MKIDVETFEPFVLDGARITATISSVIIIEFDKIRIGTWRGLPT